MHVNKNFMHVNNNIFEKGNLCAHAIIYENPRINIQTPFQWWQYKVISSSFGFLAGTFLCLLRIPQQEIPDQLQKVTYLGPILEYKNGSLR